MTIDERLATESFPLPAIREVNRSLHPTGISLGLGELKTFDPDVKIIEAVSEHLYKQGVNYCPNAGLPELRDTVARSQAQIDGHKYDIDNVVITIGVQNAIYSTVKTLSRLGARRVLIPAINFGIYKKIPAEFGLEVITYPLNDDHGIDTGWLKSNVRADDIIIINSPSNPTGRVLRVKEMIDLAGVLESRLTEGYVISDEIYGKLVYDGETGGSFSKYFARTIVVDGISKSGAVAGLRVGWVITANKTLAAAIVSNNASIISAPPTANQYGAIPVVSGETKETIDGYNQILLQSRDHVMKVLDENSISYVKPTGSFYLFADLSGLTGGNTKEFCIAAAKKENGVVVIPGVAFGAPESVRISLATGEIKEGMRRFIDVVGSFRL